MNIHDYSTWKGLRDLKINQIVVANRLHEDLRVNGSTSLTPEQIQASQDKVENAISQMSRAMKKGSDSGSMQKFTSAIILGCRIIWDVPRVPTMATDGYNLYISSAFVQKLTVEQVKAILCHEVFHIALMHMKRQKGVVGDKPTKKEFRRWNIACDYEINPILVNEGLITAEVLVGELKGLYKKEYEDMDAEEIFKLLGNQKMPMPPQAEKNQKQPPVKPKVGDYIKTKDGKIGKVTKVHEDDSVDYEELSPEETAKLKEQFKKTK